jgi:hypothetical protein
MESQLQFCRDLFSALLRCKEGCKVPASFTAALVHACQRLMLEAVQLQQVGGVACVLALQLLSNIITSLEDTSSVSAPPNIVCDECSMQSSACTLAFPMFM